MTTRVLIINENTKINDEPLISLKKQGFQIHIVRSHQNYANAVTDIDPDVIIIDSSQPEKRNNRLLENVRSSSPAPILVMSVVESPGIVEKILDKGADEYLLKPVSPKLLAARIKALARRSKNTNHHSPA